MFIAVRFGKTSSSWSRNSPLLSTPRAHRLCLQSQPLANVFGRVESLILHPVFPVFRFYIVPLNTEISQRVSLVNSFLLPILYKYLVFLLSALSISSFLMWYYKQWGFSVSLSVLLVLFSASPCIPFSFRAQVT
jgi:hypothetical protein